MFKGKKVVAIIGAAGTGKRMGGPLPKQFMKIGGRTILERAVEPFEKSVFVDRILVVAGRNFIDLCQSCCQNFSKADGVLPGGGERQDSIYQGLLGLREEEKDGYVLIHDGVRPYVSGEVIERVLTAAWETGAAVPAVPVKDTIRQIDDGKQGSRTLDRKRLYQVQTPQAFQSRLLCDCYEAAQKDGFLATDDASLVERMGYPVALAEGDYANLKITTREDLPMEKIETRVGTGFDVHRLTEGRKLILGGVEIPWEKGLLGHSDADVMIHALMDAILGAAGLGDIGRHFPDTDPQFEGISSLKLLEEVKKMIQAEEYGLENCDVTIIAQRPKLAAYLPAMRAKLAQTLAVEEGRVNIKATTTEKLGFVGREEGIAAEAVCLLRRERR